MLVKYISACIKEDNILTFDKALRRNVSIKTAAIRAMRLKKFLTIPRAALVCYKVQSRKNFNKVFNQNFNKVF
jgi:hypothetical protein